MKEIKAEFNRLKKNEDYVGLGWFFWTGFAKETPGSKRRDLYSSLWDSLTKEEKERCEEV